MRAELSILIVDDLLDNRLAIKIALKKEGYKLYEAANGEEALQKCIELTPDVILMDGMMPVMDGYEATKAIRNLEEFKRTPILMITALSEKDDKIKALNFGVNDFISKPFDKHELIARCKSYANLSKINKQYILASKNRFTNLPNKSALMDDINLCQNPVLVLFKIKDYELLEEFYSEEVVNRIESKFAKIIPDIIPAKCKNSTLYHTSDGEFALLNDKKDEVIVVDDMYETCTEFQSNIRDVKILLDNYEYEVAVDISFSYNTKQLFEYSRIGLSHVMKGKRNIIFSNEIVEHVHKEAEKNIKMIKTIKNALDNKKIVSYYQPLFNNKTKQIEKYESLVRIIDEDYKVVSPFFFLDIAKKGRYYTSITKCVLDNSFKALKMTQNEISINLSALDIEDRALSSRILEFLKNNKDCAKRVIFELLEDELFYNFERVKNFITEVKKYGVKIAIDDFGAGYSNFERLIDFQPDIIKIDGSLIKNIHENTFNRNVVETIQSFATKINVKTVAEFVSNEEIFNIINEIGIDFSQGYYIDEPKELFS